MATCSTTCDAEIHVGDIGTAFEVTLEDCDGIVDLTGVSTIEYRFKDPSGTTTLKSGSVLTDGTDGKVVYNTVDGDLPTPGGWELQVRVVLPTGTWHSNKEKFKVYPNI